ncbi:MAG: thermonuclease family protein [Actinobacteria bacterium]|nr:thermonuclease family protein [Actinomycetota bacterium]
MSLPTTTSRPLRRLSAPLMLCVALVLGACGRGHAAGDAADEPGVARVERVVDGDTLRVRIAGRREAVRLIGIDTPESVRPRTPVECFAKEAARRLGELAPPGTRVRLERDVEARDRFGRLLAYAYRRHDGLFLNLALAREGYAQVATYPPNVAHTADFTAAVSDARAAGRGLWSACDGQSRSPP